MGIAGANLGAAAFTGAPEQVEASAVGASVGVHHPCQWWSERRVLFLADQHFRPRPRPGRSVRKPFPDWVDYTPHSIWIYDTTPFPAAGMAVLALEDLVSRKWITEIVSVEETSTQLQLGFTNALTAEGLLDLATTRQDRPLDPTVDDPTRPILLAVSDHGPQMPPDPPGSSSPCARSPHTSAGPAPPPTRPGSKAWSGTSRPTTHPCSRSTTRTHCLTNSPTSASTTTPSDSTPASATSPPNDEHHRRGETIRKTHEAGLEHARQRRLARHRQHRHDQHDPGPDDAG